MVKDLLHFFYTSEESPDIKDNHFELFQVSHLCVLTELKSMCTACIGNLIRVDNAAQVFQTAVLYESEELKTTAVKFAVRRWLEVEATDGYQHMEREVKATLCDIIFRVLYKFHKEAKSLVFPYFCHYIIFKS